MAIITTIKKFFKEFLDFGKPHEDDVLYHKVSKREIPDKSAEKMVMEEIKEAFLSAKSKIVDLVESSRSPDETDVSKVESTDPQETSTVKKKTVEKTAAETKTATEKKSDTTTKTTVAKKSSVKKTVDIKTEPKASTKKTAVKTKTKAVKKSASKTATKKTSAKAKTVTTDKTAEIKIEPKASTKKTATKAKTTVAKKSDAADKKTAALKTTAKSKTRKKATTKKSDKKLEKTPRDTKIDLYTKDIKKHYDEVDADFLKIVVKNLGPSIFRKDAELVSCSDPKELDTVRRNFLVKKLGLTLEKDELDKMIQEVCQELKGVRAKYRATFYYRLAKKCNKESALS